MIKRASIDNTVMSLKSIVAIPQKPRLFSSIHLHNPTLHSFDLKSRSVRRFFCQAEEAPQNLLSLFTFHAHDLPPSSTSRKILEPNQYVNTIASFIFATISYLTVPRPRNQNNPHVNPLISLHILP